MSSREERLRKLLPGDPDYLAGDHFREVEFSTDGSAVSTAPTLSLYSEYRHQNTSDFHLEFQMTIQTRIERLSRKQATILSTISIVKAITVGIDIQLYLVQEWLLNFLTKSKPDFVSRNPYEQRAIQLITLCISLVRGEWLTMDGREKLPPEVLKLIPREWLPSQRTWESWQSTYRLEKFFQVRIVPLSVLIEDRTQYSERYSSYTKGYGNGGSTDPVEKTPYSFELDGDMTEQSPPTFPLEDLVLHNRLMLEIERAKAAKRKTSK